MANAIDLMRFVELIDRATPSRMKTMELEFPQGATFVGEKEPPKKFMESCERGILVPIIVDADLHVIDGVRRAIAAFTVQLPDAPCLIVEKLTEMERLAYRVLINPDRTATPAVMELLKGKVNFKHLPNMRYRDEILQKASDAIRARHSMNSKLAKDALRLNATFLKSQVRIADLMVEAIAQLDALLAGYTEDLPEQLVAVRHKLATATKDVVRFRQEAENAPYGKAKKTT
jgi:ParB-like chromosome segregation protein Spo0J